MKNEENIKQYTEKVSRIINRYLEKDGWIHRKESENFIDEVEAVLEEDIPPLISSDRYMMAFEVINHIFILIGDIDIEDPDGYLGMLMEQTYDLWMDILEYATEEEREKIFDWFTDHLNGIVPEDMQYYIEEILMEEFFGGGDIKHRLYFIEKMIKKLATEKYFEWNRSYNVGRWSEQYLGLLETQKNSKEKIEQFCREYWDNPTVRKYYINFCKKEKEYEKAVKALDESISLDQDNRELVSDYQKIKKEIYRQQGNREEYIKQLWVLVLDYEDDDLDAYRELRKQYAKKDWMEKREEVFEKFQEDDDHLQKMYREEKLYDRLLESVLKSPGVDALQQYEKVLKKIYPEQILKKYQEEAERMAENTSDRKTYRQIVEILRNMKQIKGGYKIVGEMVKEWKVKYKNRRAMMDELGKL